MRLIGVDFSGASDAGKRIWIARAVRPRAGLALTELAPIRESAEGRSDLHTALAALRRLIAAAEGAAVGLDFPFSLPRPLIAPGSWRDFVLGFARRFPTPEDFRHACVAAAGGRELKRATDRAARVPFSAYNIRLYRQTHAGIGGVLAPLLATDAARVLPFQEGSISKPRLAEICPASTLKRLGLYCSYKGNANNLARARSRILAALIAQGEIADVPQALRRRIVDDSGGDALDAVLALIGAAAAVRKAPPQPDADAKIEGCVYF